MDSNIPENDNKKQEYILVYTMTFIWLYLSFPQCVNPWQFFTLYSENLANSSIKESLCLVDPTLEKYGGKSYFLRYFPTLSFHVTIPAKEQSITIKYTCTLLYHNHTKLHTLPQESWRRCQTGCGITVGCPVLTGKYTVKKHPTML